MLGLEKEDGGTERWGWGCLGTRGNIGQYVVLMKYNSVVQCLMVGIKQSSSVGATTSS